MTPSVLAIGAHPDDIEIGCGGTLLLMKQKGYAIDLALVTSGEEGSLTDRDSTKSRRESEARDAAEFLGARQVLFLHEPDGLSSYRPATKTCLIKTIRTLKPSIVFMHSRIDRFPDHKVVSRLSLEAIQAAAGPWYPETGGQPHSVRQCFGFEVWNPISDPQTLVDISDVIDKKIQMLRCHASQVESVKYADAIRGLARYRGAMGMAGEFAEAFEVIRAGLYL